MSIIEVSGLSKQYRIGTKAPYKTLRESIMSTLAAHARLFSRHSSHNSPFTLHPSPSSDTIWALKDVSFEVNEGEVIGIIGRNGAGKTTLLKILSRVTEPTKGMIKLRGRVASLLEVGTGFHPELTGRENIYLNGAILGMNKFEIKKKFNEIVAFAEIEKFLDTPVKRYSSGMYVRLAFAVAAHLEPEILVVDEVLAVGDAQFQKKCLGKMKDVSQSGRTVLFVSHNMPAMNVLCTRGILLDGGNIIKEGDTRSVVQYYLEAGANSSTCRIWQGDERPGNSSFRLNSVTIKDTSGNEISSVNISEDAVVEIEYEVVKKNARVGFSLVLFDGTGNCVLSSLSNSEEEYYGRPMELGKYLSDCRMYGNLLNEGHFSISIIGFGSQWSDQFKVDYVISFDANDDGILKRDYHGRYGGTIRPRFEWRTIPKMLSSG